MNTESIVELEAIKTLQIGFVVSNSYPLCFDIDHCVEKVEATFISKIKGMSEAVSGFIPTCSLISDYPNYDSRFNNPVNLMGNIIKIVKPSSCIFPNVIIECLLILGQ